jgi:hypothetical protein
MVFSRDELLIFLEAQYKHGLSVTSSIILALFGQPVVDMLQDMVADGTLTLSSDADPVIMLVTPGLFVPATGTPALDLMLSDLHAKLLQGGGGSTLGDFLDALIAGGNSSISTRSGARTLIGIAKLHAIHIGTDVGRAPVMAAAREMDALANAIATREAMTP